MERISKIESEFEIYKEKETYKWIQVVKKKGSSCTTHSTLEDALT